MLAAVLPPRRMRVENHDNLHALVDFPANDSPECGQLDAENDGT